MDIISLLILINNHLIFTSKNIDNLIDIFIKKKMLTVAESITCPPEDAEKEVSATTLSGMSYYMYNKEIYTQAKSNLNVNLVNSKEYLTSFQGTSKSSLPFALPSIGNDVPALSNYSIAKSARSMNIAKQFIKNHEDSVNNPIPPFEVIGDNLDFTIAPTQMTKERQRKSIHWFMNIVVEKRVVSDLPNDKPKKDILQVPNCEFVPNITECNSLDNHMAYHIAKVICKHVTCLKPFEKCIPDCIDHPFMKELTKKSKYRVLDLLNKSENNSADMISILQNIHENCIAHTDEIKPEVIEQIVFGGDVLTNERAYSAQSAMLNGETDYLQLRGIIHRPEGLHRMMNILLVFTACSVDPVYGSC